MWWRDLLRGGVVGEVRRKGKVPAGKALVEERKERLAALAQHSSSDGVDVGNDLQGMR